MLFLVRSRQTPLIRTRTRNFRLFGDNASNNKNHVEAVPIRKEAPLSYKNEEEAIESFGSWIRELHLQSRICGEKSLLKVAYNDFVAGIRYRDFKVGDTIRFRDKEGVVDGKFWFMTELESDLTIEGKQTKMGQCIHNSYFEANNFEIVEVAPAKRRWWQRN